MLPSQQVPEVGSVPAPLTSQPGQNLSIPPTVPGIRAQGKVREIPLPEVFRGCWSGTVPALDSIQSLNPNLGRLIWLTKSYTLCYKQAGYNGKWQLTFAKSSVTDRIGVSDQHQVIRVKSVSGSNTAELTAYMHFRTHSLFAFGMSSHGSTLDELAHLHCQVIPDRNVMAVSAAVFVETDGEPSANVTWHTNFFRMAQQG
jgi:hypothetical protein